MPAQPTTVDKPASPLAELLYLAAPTVAQMASYTAMQFIDRLMLSRGGELQATAAANSGMLAFSMIALGMGSIVMVNTLVSQSFGRGEKRRCGRYLWQGIWLAVFFGLLLLPVRSLAGPIFHAFGHPPDLARMEAVYFRILLMSATAKLAGTSVGQFLLGINRPLGVLGSAVVGVGVNAVAAWCVVLGHGGFHPHGVAGAAWAQNLGVTCEMATLAAIALLRSDLRRSFGVFDIALRPAELLTLIRIGIPSGAQWFSDVLAWSIFCNGVVGKLGAAAMAGNTFMLSYMVMSFMPAYGLSTAVLSLVGRYIGRGQPDVAIRRANLGFAVTAVYIVCCGTVFVTCRTQLMHLFTHDPLVVHVGSIYLIFAAIYELTDSMYIIYSGGLRGAGDTLVPAVVMAALCWSITVGGGYAVARWIPMINGQPFYGGPWIMACIYGAILGLFIRRRFARGRWRRIHLEPQRDDDAASNASVIPATLS
jgi:MATE family multidrug resistance protein